MKRILLMVFRNLFFVPYGWFKLCWYASHAERYSEEQRYQLLKYVDNRAVKGGNLVIDGHGMENIPKENGFIFFPNHQGLFDYSSNVKSSYIFKEKSILYSFDKCDFNFTIHC